ncbi:MAG: ribulose-phosphate 3-epimerase [Bacteroidetes bacterium HGW-Bacteroidetes-1]|jgi:ribulose-phosphate 3-epimerase|nr:MAG: ribulose-phosphate 3-epimerase [Bacteroidetes bacterium HGW-Bacteroidetes-1]
MKPLIAPSLLAADFLHLADDIEMVNQSDADLFHCDVMDGIFVPNISFGMPVISAIKKMAKKPLDVHLMIVQPERFVNAFKEVGADWLSVHYEACNHLHRVLQQIRDCGMKAGVVLNPHSSVSLIENAIHEADYVLLMSVNPGFGGQSFIPFTLDKIYHLKELILKKNLPALIEVDGGVGLHNAKELINSGADILVAGNAVFQTEDPKNVIKLLKNSC